VNVFLIPAHLGCPLNGLLLLLLLLLCAKRFQIRSERLLIDSLWPGGRVKPIVTATDKNIVTAGDLSVSVVLTPELVEPFIQKLEEISHLSLKHRLVYAFLFYDLMVKSKLFV